MVWQLEHLATRLPLQAETVLADLACRLAHLGIPEGASPTATDSSRHCRQASIASEQSSLFLPSCDDSVPAQTVTVAPDTFAGMPAARLQPSSSPLQAGNAAAVGGMSSERTSAASSVFSAPGMCQIPSAQPLAAGASSSGQVQANCTLLDEVQSAASRQAESSVAPPASMQEDASG